MKKTTKVLPWVIALLVAVASSIPLIRGGGIYRLDPPSLAREWLIWDAITLGVALPALIVSTLYAMRGSMRGKLTVMGLSLYFAYVYLFYAMTYAQSALFVVYVAAFAFSGVNLFFNLAEIDVAFLKSRISSKFPRRILAVFTICTALVLVVLWAWRIVAMLTRSELPEAMAEANILETQAIDLGLVVPLQVIAAILLWRKHAWGYLLAALTLTFGLMMFVLLPAWIVVPAVEDGTFALAEATPLLAICAMGFLFLVLFYRNVRA